MSGPGEFESSTLAIPETAEVPRHVAIIMDGNGRWAKKRFLPRVGGHRRGVETVREIVKACMKQGVEYLTLFAFSSENWRRPKEEVTFLMQLFLRSLEQEVEKLHENGIRFKVVGDLEAFDSRIVAHIRRGEELTAANKKLTLTIAANYGGRWDILQAANRCREEDPAAPINEARLARFLSMSYAPEPDLFIRTGGEQRVSNFLLWQLAYAEFYFTDALWPDFGAQALDEAFASYRRRERRFGRTSEQLTADEPISQAG
jgi:undecaprenyl diphosphate synthase